MKLFLTIILFCFCKVTFAQYKGNLYTYEGTPIIWDTNKLIQNNDFIVIQNYALCRHTDCCNVENDFVSAEVNLLVIAKRNIKIDSAYFNINEKIKDTARNLTYQKLQSVISFPESWEQIKLGSRKNRNPKFLPYKIEIVYFMGKKKKKFVVPNIALYNSPTLRWHFFDDKMRDWRLRNNIK